MGNEHRSYISNVCLLGNDRIVSCSRDKTIRVWDIASSESLLLLEGHTENVEYVCVVDTQEGMLIVSGTSNSIRVWDSTTGECLHILEVPTREGLLGLDALGNQGGQKIVTGTTGVIRIWDPITGTSLRVIYAKSISCICVLRDGRIVNGRYDGDCRLQIWDSATGESLKVLTGHTRRVICIRELQGGRIVSGAWDSTLRIWSPNTGTCLQVLTGHKDYVDTICVLSDGRFVSGSWDNTLRVWDITKKNPKVLKIIRPDDSGHLCGIAAIDDTRFVGISPFFYNQIVIWDISKLDSFPKPDRSSIRHKIQNYFRGPTAESTITTVNPAFAISSLPPTLSENKPSASLSQTVSTLRPPPPPPPPRARLPPPPPPRIGGTRKHKRKVIKYKKFKKSRRSRH